MEKCIVIGLGNFGMTVAQALMENGIEVLGIDIDKDTVQKAKDMVSHAVIGNATNRAVIDSLGLKDFDAAVVSIGQEMAASILISLYLMGRVYFFGEDYKLPYLGPRASRLVNPY